MFSVVGKLHWWVHTKLKVNTAQALLPASYISAEVNL